MKSSKLSSTSSSGGKPACRGAAGGFGFLLLAALLVLHLLRAFGFGIGGRSVTTQHSWHISTLVGERRRCCSCAAGQPIHPLQ
ncbi:hypothetical protein ABZ079_29595 [Streptomyces sp. NPDC006314]|uniref:hypothetical protein n=1 Tax=Streptomyces sp. NPDC006314 TaxID=3154475 RepID=UPI00339F6E90